MTEKEFVTQYVLNRAKAHTGGLSAECVNQAKLCWSEIRTLRTYE